MAIKIEMLRVFRAVAEAGNLAEAAGHLGRTPSAVSMMLKQFEEHLGAPLFHGGRKGQLSALGELVLVEARRETDHFERTVAAIDSLARADSGLVRLAAPPSIAATFLPPILARFLAEKPDIRLSLRDLASVDVMDALASGEIDIGIAATAPLRGFVPRRIGGDPFGVVCRADSPLAKAERALTFSDLAGETFLVNGLCALIDDEGFRAIVDAARLSVPNTASLLGMVRAGVGVTALPRLAYLAAPEGLAFVPFGPRRFEREVSLFLPEGGGLAPVAAALAAQIMDENFSRFED